MGGFGLTGAKAPGDGQAREAVSASAGDRDLCYRLLFDVKTVTNFAKLRCNCLFTAWG